MSEAPAPTSPANAMFESGASATRTPAARLWTEGRVFLLLAVIIGLFSGLLVVCFRLAIDGSRLLLLGARMTPAWPRVVIAPTLTGLLIGFLVVRFFPRIRGSGVNQTKAALYIYNGFISFRTVVGKFIICSLAIGSGQSLGPEDPALQIGAGLASVLGRVVRLSPEKIRLIAPVGAAAGLAAAFNSPITAVLFVIEEVIGTWSAGVLGAIVLSAIASVAVERWFLGAEPLFRIPPYQMTHPAELLSYVALGIVGGCASLLYVKLLAWLRPVGRRAPVWMQYLMPALAGAIIGFIGLRLPQVMGAGYPFMDQAMHGQYTWQILAILGIVKILTTVLSFSSGAPGGMFAPTLFMGAMIGASVGGLQHVLVPWLPSSVGAYALVGMGTMFAGALRAPMTSIFMILEVSANYSIIVPVMISNTIAYLLSRKYQPVPIFDVLSRQEGTELPSMEELREETALRVENAMHWDTGPVFAPGDTANYVLAQAGDKPPEHLLVHAGTGDWRLVSREAIERAAAAQPPERVGALMGQRLPLLHRDRPLDAALRLIGDWPLLPVVHRANFDNIEGVLSLNDVLTCYREHRHRQ